MFGTDRMEDKRGKGWLEYNNRELGLTFLFYWKERMIRKGNGSENRAKCFRKRLTL